jgi:hypothetical protein
MENILEMDLSPEDGKLLKEALESWKEEVYASLLEKVEEAKERKLEELEEASIEYKENLKKEYSDKMLKSLKEMEKDIRAKVVAEVVAENPEVQILEQIKELIAPTLNEDYAKNVYTEEIQTLREMNEALEERMELEEGARKLAELVSPYTRKTQNLIISLVNEGGPDEVSEQFYSIIESLSMNEEDEDMDDEDEDWDDEDLDDEDMDDMDDEDWDDEEDPMSTMPKVEDYDDMEEFGQAVADWQEEQDMEDDEDEEDDEDWDDEDLDDEDEDDDETDVDVDVEESYRGSSVREGRKGKSRRKKVNEARNEFKERMLNLSE